MTFVAIDFETATSQPYSACAVGIISVQDSVITDEFECLIQPPKNLYFQQNTKVHGLSANDTKHALAFDNVFVEIQQRLIGKQVVAHNESFDRNVLKQCIAHYQLSSKGLLLHRNWNCTVKLSQHLGYSPNKLSDCCQRFNIPLQHHDALSDARACAILFMQLSAQQRKNKMYLF
ncbi:MAG: exonuclease domain-containing protein [Chitinophagales bacterium]|nr:exonuclease domain-containing protein [Chitinophagales bacterium]